MRIEKIRINKMKTKKLILNNKSTGFDWNMVCGGQTLTPPAPKVEASTEKPPASEIISPKPDDNAVETNP